MTRLEQARAEIARLRGLAQEAARLLETDPQWWSYERLRLRSLIRADARHIAANDPVHVLAVLAAADATLDRHGRSHTCSRRRPPPEIDADGWFPWPDDMCPDAAAVLDLYAPEVPSG